jgi:sugar lactone lactonase YvrE
MPPHAEDHAAAHAERSPTDAPPAFTGHDGGRFDPAPTTVVASWPAGHFAENLAVDRVGTVFVSLHSHDRIDRYDPRSGTVDTFAQLPTAVTGLAFDDDGVLWATGGRVGTRPGVVWRIHPDATVEEWVQLPDASFLNGCTFTPDGRTLLVCESIAGRILAVDRQSRGWSVWITDDRLRPRTAGVPGANGIKVRDEQVWISVTDLDMLYRVALHTDGTPGRLEEVARNLRADDFAFDVAGSLHIATHPAHTVLRLDPDLARTTIAGPRQGATGSTACAFGRAPDDETALYVTTTGGLGLPGMDEPQEAKLLRIDVGRRGQLLRG